MYQKVIDHLKQRYFVCKGPRSMVDIEEAIGVSRYTLARFARGGYVSMATLEAIEDWVCREELTLRQDV